MLAEINNNKIFYYDSETKNKPVLLLLHAFPLNHKMWLHQSKVLKNDFRIIAPDFRGFGQSIANNYDFSMDLFADDVYLLLNHLEIKNANILGLSMGGYVSFRLFEKHPEIFSTLILSSTRAEEDTDEGKRLRSITIQNILTNGLKDFTTGFINNMFTKNANNLLLNEVSDLILANNKETICATLKALANRPDSTYLLKKISVPTCIIVGKEDKVTPISCSEFLHKNINNSKLEIIQNASHLCNIEKSEEFNRIIYNFLKQI